MADSHSGASANCAQCNKTPSALGRPLKQCAKCHRARYCDRTCQQAHWKQHKKACCAPPSNPPRPSASSTTATSPTTVSTPSTLFKNLQQQNVAQPFHRLHAKTWLHDRPEEDVFLLLIDAYRFRMEDNHMFGNSDADSLHAGASSGESGFHRFLSKAESRPGLLPPWWSSEKRDACLEYGKRPGSWSDLRVTVEKQNIIEEYGNALAPMQLRMFAEQIIGSGPGGQNGNSMMQMQMMAERGEMHSSVMDVSQFMG